MNRYVYFALKIAALGVFFGRGYQHFFWDAPYRSLLWDQGLLEPVFALFGINWRNYVTDLEIDRIIQNFIKATGVLYFLCGCIVLSIQKRIVKWKKVILYVGISQILLLSFLITKEKFYHIAMFFEHSIQFTTPLLFIWYVSNYTNQRILLVLKIVIALTFLCHGIYATGFVYPIPANFVTMTMNILGVSDIVAKKMLLIAAIIDFAIVVLIFIPRVSNYVLLYAVFWGLITAFARPWSNLTYDFSFLSIHQSIHEMLYRLSHGLIPLALFLLLKDKAYSKEYSQINVQKNYNLQ